MRLDGPLFARGPLLDRGPQVGNPFVTVITCYHPFILFVSFCVLSVCLLNENTITVNIQSVSLGESHTAHTCMRLGSEQSEEHVLSYKIPRTGATRVTGNMNINLNSVTETSVL